MNEIIKVLTLISTIMLPLAVISGVYGMNLAELPLADHPYAFEFTLAFMAAVVIGMVYFFKRRNWI